MSGSYRLKRGDRLVIDDVRADDTYEVLTLLASRGEGTCVGIHCGIDDNPLGALTMMARLGGRSPEETIQQLLGRAVQLIVQVARTDEGRRIVNITEVQASDGAPKANTLFVYDGGFSAAGTPSFS